MGTLYVVATPIGNLADMSPRAIETLRSVRLIAAENTRHSGRLLKHFGIETPLLSYHQHNQRVRRDQLLAALAEGDVALITDAGTPAVSDPGADIVAAALDAGYPVSPIPGPSALVAAVSASGLVGGPFVSLGFLPRESLARRRVLARATVTGLPLVLFEAAPRVARTLDDLHAALGDRPAVLMRELTKLYEEVRSGTLLSLREWTATAPPRGEVVLVIAGNEEPPDAELDAPAVIDELRRAGLSASQAAREAATITGLPRSDLYRLAQAWPGRSVGLECELPLPDEDALKKPFGNQKRPERRKS